MGYTYDDAIKALCIKGTRFFEFVKKNKHAREQIMAAVMKRDSELLVKARQRIMEALDGRYDTDDNPLVSINTAMEVRKLAHDSKHRRTEMVILDITDKARALEATEIQMKALKGLPVTPVNSKQDGVSTN